MKKHFYQQLSNCCWIPLILAFANVSYKPIKNDNKILYFVFQKKNNLPPCDHYAVNIFNKNNYDFFYK